MIEKYKVSILYTAPTLIRTWMKWGDEYPNKFNLSSLRLLGSVGEPINPEAWMWYREVVGKSNCPIVDTWWQTETGAIMISPLPGVTATKPGSAMLPLPGISAKVVDDSGKEVGPGSGGYLVLDKPWPSMLRGVWKEPDRYKETYWSRYEGLYFAGDGAKLDSDNALWVLGRVDDVMNVSGHRISTTEVESALVSHDAVAEAAVVGAKDDLTGQAIVAFVILRGGVEAAKDGLEKALRDHVAKEIGAIAKPKQIMVVNELPKTRSGKIMRRLLRDVVGDATTLADPNVMKLIAAGLQSGKKED
jgi:acetyl-CoA synthetase